MLLRLTLSPNRRDAPRFVRLLVYVREGNTVTPYLRTGRRGERWEPLSWADLKAAGVVAPAAPSARVLSASEPVRHRAPGFRPAPRNGVRDTAVRAAKDRGTAHVKGVPAAARPARSP